MNTQQDDEKVVRDGEVLRRPLMLMDGLTKDRPAITIIKATDAAPGHNRPRSASLSSADRDRQETMYAARDKKLSNAWRDDFKPTVESPVHTSTGNVLSTIAGQNERLSNAWREPKYPVTALKPPETEVQERLRKQAEVEKEFEAAGIPPSSDGAITPYDKYDNRLADAWKA